MTQHRKRAWKKWRKLISQQAKSGQSVAAFCRKRGLCAPHFFAWRKRLAQATAEKFVEVQVTVPATAVPRVVADPAIEIRLEKSVVFWGRTEVGSKCFGDHVASRSVGYKV
jgi:hypothetical protein